MMFYNNNCSPPSQEIPMDLLISPFEPISLQYPNNDDADIHNNDSTQPLDVPMQQNNNDLMMYDSSPIALSNHMPKPIFHNSLPSSHIDMLGNFTNDVSRSPESSTSTESNMVSPPQQYYPSNDLFLQDTAMQQQQNYLHHRHNYQHHSASKRSASVPPHSHKFKPHVQDSMYNQFQVTPSLHQQQQHLKALPIKIQRVSAQTQPIKPLNAESLRRQLDEKLEKVNFDDVTVAELKEMLRERGLSATGRKAELMNRLKEEYELLMQKGGASGAASGAAANSGSSPTSSSSGLRGRVASMNLGSPKKQSTRFFSPYLSPQSSSTRHHPLRYACSVPDSHTSPFLNDQFMMKKPSNLRPNIGQENERREWNHAMSVSPPNNLGYPSIEETSHNSDTPALDIWDDQTLQKFLNEI